MGIKCGIVGLPNVGKSTLFNALTNANIDAANYPFCTIEPNIGLVAVPDTRLDRISALVHPQKTQYTTMEFVDIAGLVSGASKGEGLGNQFLAHIRETHAIAHVVRCFDSDDITHVAGYVDPIQDIETIHTELVLADLDSLQKNIQKQSKTAKSGDKLAKQQLQAYEAVAEHCNQGELVINIPNFHHYQTLPVIASLITAKPMMYIANVDESGCENNQHLAAVCAYAKQHNAMVIPVCASIEQELNALSVDERDQFLIELGLDEPGLNRVIRAGYQLLGLETYFTAGEKEARAWTIPKGATAPKAAGCIHSDFEKGFIRAEVIAYTDFITYQGEQGAKEAGKWRLEGKDYIVQDGDVILFRFNV